MIQDDEAKRNISANVKRLLAEHIPPWSQADLARATGESEMRISFLARGVNLPSAALLARVAEALGCTSDQLLSPLMPELSEKSG